MNWQEWTEKMVGEKENFTRKEVQEIVRKTLGYECDCWVNQRA